MNDELFIFTKTSIHIILSPLNWNLFAGCKDNPAELIHCSTAETAQKMDRLAFVCCLFLLHRGASEGHRMSSCSNLRELCQEVRHLQLWERLGTFRASTMALEASEVTLLS